MNPAVTQKFNDDLLLTKRDRQLACELFPEFAHVLDFPELRKLFIHHEALAKRAKTSGRIAGSLAIGFGVVALLVASATPLFEKYSANRGGITKVVGVIAALLGVASILIGGFGALTRGSKQRWLCHRLMTERLRQFQFQVLACRTHEVLASTDDDHARERFRKDRASWFEDFRLAHVGHLPAKLRAALDDDAEVNFLLHHNLESRRSFDAPVLDKLFSAYRLLRLEHQLQYADYKLRPDDRIVSSSAARQLAVLRDVSLVLIAAVLVTHLALALWLGFRDVPTPWVHALIIWLAIGVLAVRAIEEGLQPGREVERYAAYRSSMSSLLTRFKNANPEDRIRIMLETERAVYEEMRGFLRTNNDARYVL